MFLHIFTFHLKTSLKRPVLYISSILMFTLPLFLFLGTGGFFDPASISESSAVRWLNSPYQVARSLHFSGLFLILLLPALVAPPIHGDVRYKVFPLLYSYPVHKITYLTAIYSSVLTILFLLSLLPGSAFLLGEQLLGSQNPLMGPFHFDGYLKFYLLNMLPNLFIFGTWVFVLTALSRKISTGFLFVLTLFVLQIISENLFPVSHLASGLMDPFGETAAFQSASSWSLEQQNQNTLPLTRIWLLNRLLWGASAIFAWGFLFRIFTFTHQGWNPLTDKLPFSNRKQSEPLSRTRYGTSPISIKSGTIQLIFQIWTLTLLKFRFLLSLWSVWIIGILGIATVVLLVHNVTQTQELVMLPMTRIILAIPAFLFSNIVVFSLFFYSGQLIARDRDHQMEELVHATSVRSCVLSLSSAFSLLLLALFYLFLLKLTGITIQLLSGFQHIQLDQYAIAIWGLMLPGLAVWIAISMGVHTVLRNLYIGMLTLFLIWIGQFGTEYLGLDSNIIRLEPIALMMYSDLNGYGHQLQGHIVTLTYWLFAGSILLLIGHLFNQREAVHRFNERWTLIRRRISHHVVSIFILLFFGYLLLFLFIIREERAEFNFQYAEQEISRYEERFAHLSDIPQPRIRTVHLTVDLYPDEQRFETKGRYILQNHTGFPIDTLLIRTGFDELTRYKISTENETIKTGEPFPFFVHKLITPLQPGDSLFIDFSIRNRPNRIFQRNSNVLANGTFLTQDILPRLGYQSRNQDVLPTDLMKFSNHYQAIDSDLVHFDITVSTSSDQMAFSIGELESAWQENGRNLYHYKTPQPVKFSLFISSGRYQLTADSWSEIPILLYHHPDHTHNLNEIVAGVKASLDLNSQLFEAYSGRTLRIIEFPSSEGSFGTAKPGSLLLSESIFGVKSGIPERIRFPFYIAAHETTHHWFGQQLLPARARGSTVITESLTEYLTLLLYEEAFGNKAARQFLNIQHDRYLRGRRVESNEPPLLLAASQDEYLSYGKGSLVLNRLSSLIGKDQFLRVLSSFYSRFKTTGKTETIGYSYPASLHFLDEMNSAVPDSIHPLVYDLFQTVTLYDNRVLSAKSLNSNKGEYSTEVTYSFKKQTYGEVTGPYDVEMIQFVLINETHDMAKMFEVPFDSGKGQISFRTTFHPAKVELDPGILFIDQSRRDNVYWIK